MKKSLVLVVCVILAVAMFAGCAAPAATPSAEASTEASVEASTEASAEASTEASEPAADGKGPLVGISVPNNPTGWVAAVQWSAKQTAEELGLNYVLVASDSVNDQANKIDELIQMGCEYIVMMPDNDELAVAAQKVLDAGITLIDFDRTLGDVQPDYYVAGDNTGMGVAGGEYIVDKLGPDGGKVVIMNIPSYGEIFTERVDGFKSVAAEHPELEIIGEYASDNGAPETVLTVMSDVLTANPEIDAIYSSDDEMSQGILQAIKEAGRTDIKVITGGGGAKTYFDLFDDYPDIWVSSQTYAPYMMADAVKIADKLIKGETVEQKTIIPTSNVDRENVEQYLKDNNITEDAPY
ncbi:substrate-binding domain-containing protein [Christensenella intestinihominis]|uniref:substrate-binding domain-containing protein n=1 Tax=Christensenella intestinihominis TaxID=1851429 RepID=UPI00082BC940|nr:substrate-binding domain-containing protein [Christensenella intestinihominis]